MSGTVPASTSGLVIPTTFSENFSQSPKTLLDLVDPDLRIVGQAGEEVVCTLRDFSDVLDLLQEGLLDLQGLFEDTVEVLNLESGAGRLGSRAARRGGL